ncbi:hypothetical protein LEP3755_19220 [Leptolyngbya sp. NIES-3755]|nr:hypothetical protein LEP3755_19220 [Leptolyngbya sp. NIES-3755]
MTQTVLIDAFYTAGINGHGGDHRTSQLFELLEQANLKIAVMEKPRFNTQIERYQAGFKALLNYKTLPFVVKHSLSRITPPAEIVKFGFQSQIYSEAIKQHNGSKVLIWETTKHSTAPYIAKQRGFKVIAVPHNLDCFVLPPQHFHQNFDQEIESLRAAQVVFCISREEQWLLKLRGINADFLPYYPPASIVERLLEVRTLRKTSPKKNLLILGSAGNIPTFQGMVEQIQWLHHLREQQAFTVDIVGYQTQLLQPYCKHDDFVVHGAVTPEELNQFLTHATVALVHQKAAAGALTRIPELLIAGVPLIANSVAARSAYCFSGIHCYDTLPELAALLLQSFEMPDLPQRPVDAEKRFIECVRQMTDSSQV